MDYLFVLRADASGFATLPQAALRASAKAFRSYTVRLARRGAMKNALHLKDPMTATTVSREGQGRVLHDGSGDVGPRQVTGLYVVTAPSLDDALALADDCPILQFGGTVEVRPLHAEPGTRRRSA